MSVESRTLSVSINRNPDEVYAFVSNPENLPQWAPAFCESVRRSGAEWIVETPDGPVKIRFVTRNEFRVADHYVSPASGVEFYVPMRVIANGSGGSEVLLTLLRQSTMSHEQFRRDIDLVTRDLNTLKRVLEKKASADGTEWSARTFTQVNAFKDPMQFLALPRFLKGAFLWICPCLLERSVLRSSRSRCPSSVRPAQPLIRWSRLSA